MYNNYQNHFVQVCEEGKENIIKYLIEHGAEVNKISPSCQTPLCCACEKGNEKIVKCLIEHGADINKVKSFNQTPLYTIILCM